MSGVHLPLLVWLSPAFPVGAFAYSHGLEWAHEAGDLTDAASLEDWLGSLLAFGVGAQRRDPVRGGLPGRRRRRRRKRSPRSLSSRSRSRPPPERRLETTTQGDAFVGAIACRVALRRRSILLKRGLARAGRLSGRGRGRGGGPRHPARAGPGGLRPRLRLEPRLGRGPARDRRPDRRTAGHRRARAAGPAARRFGQEATPRRSRRLRLPVRSRVAAPRDPVHEAVPLMSASPHGPLRVGIGGPVGSGKTALMEALCKRFRDRYDLCAITNDIYTKEDARLLTVAGALPEERIMGVETGGCPHTAIREDCSINLAAIDAMTRRFPDLDLILDRIRRRQPRRDLLARARRPHDLRHRRVRRREDPAQGRTRDHALRPPRHQQDRPRAACRREPRRDGARTPGGCAARGPSCSPICAPARASRRWRASSRRRAGSPKLHDAPAESTPFHDVGARRTFIMTKQPPLLGSLRFGQTRGHFHHDRTSLMLLVEFE